jgi:ribosomal protein S18 acetylase RimI-like enzyme
MYKSPKLLSSFTSRPYEQETDLNAMRGMLMDARSLTSDWRFAHVGELQFNFFMAACHLDVKRHFRLWFSGHRLAGFAMLGEDPSFDFQVHPEFEWQGIEEEVMSWAETLVADLRREDAQTWGRPIVSGSRQDNPKRITFLETHGFKPGGEFSEVNMIRSLAKPIPPVVMPAGCEMRSMDQGFDISARARVQHDVWQPWTVGNVNAADYAYFMTLPGYDPNLDIFAVAPDGTVATYVNGWLDPVNHIGDQGPVGALPDFRRKGYTRAVLLECLRRMQERGMDRACISTGVNNIAAQQLYQSIGFEIVNGYTEFIESESGE